MEKPNVEKRYSELNIHERINLRDVFESSFVEPGEHVIEYALEYKKSDHKINSSLCKMITGI